MSRPIAEFQNVCKVYRTGLLRRTPIVALRDVTLSIPAGSVFGVLGPNRAGKTTLIKVLLSICRPTAGKIRRLGLPAHDRSTLARIGYLHESQAFPRYLTAMSLLRYYGRLSLVPGPMLDERIPRLLEQLGLADRAHEPIATFSKGMAQRLALAQSLVNDPDLLVLDEPTEGMDFLARKLLHDAICLRREEGKTAILVSHNMDDVRRLCDQVAILQAGRLVFTGPLTDLADGSSSGASIDAVQGALEAMYCGACP